jgi:HK97 family phage major capsid protein
MKKNMNFLKRKAVNNMKKHIKRILETRSLPTLLEQRNTLLDEMDSLVKKAKEETRAFSDDESNRFETIKSEITKIDKTLKAEEEARALESKRTKVTTGEEDQRALKIAEEERAFLQFVQEGRATNMPASTNGSIIPLSVANKIVDKVVQLSPILAKTTKFNVTGDLIFPTYDYTQHTTAYATEFAAVTASNGAFGQVKLTSLIVGTLAKIGRSLINRTDIDVLSYVISAIAKSIATFLEKELVSGVGGAGKVQGLAQVAAGQQQVGITTLVITSDELVALQMKVPQVYQADACWIMNPTTLAYIQSLKATTGQFLMGNTLSENGRWMLLGKEVCISDNIPVNGVTNLCIFYGDMSGLYVKMTHDVQVQVMNEIYAAEYAVGIAAFVELDAAIVETQKIVAYKGK